MTGNRLFGDRPGIRALLALFGVAVGINYIWEMAQMPLYQNMPFDALSSWLICFRASLGDGVIVLAIWALGAAVYRRLDWFRPVRPGSLAILVLSGAAIAVAIEIHALATDRWAYSDLMPLVPVFEVGLSPFVQLLVLPLLSMKLAIRPR